MCVRTYGETENPNYSDCCCPLSLQTRKHKFVSYDRSPPRQLVCSQPVLHVAIWEVIRLGAYIRFLRSPNLRNPRFSILIRSIRGRESTTPILVKGFG